jgi:ABC-2 type transport system permease protein
MNKILLIIKREYLSRVKKKSFLITTLLIPLLTSGLISAVVYFASTTEQKQLISVYDESGFFTEKIKGNSSFQIQYVNLGLNEKIDTVLSRTNADIFLHIFPFKNNQPDSFILYKNGGVSLIAKEYINDELTNIFQVKQMQDAGINKSQIDSIHKSTISVKSYNLDNHQETSSEIASTIGYVMGFLIYIIIFIYGAGVMRGVMEEKTNRIAEVIISSVRPFELMMGKIIGIAFVGLTQFSLWFILLLLFKVALPLFIPSLQPTMPMAMTGMANVHDTMQVISQSENAKLYATIMGQNWGLIIGCFLFYFLGGYFLYAAMFAAVGSLVNEDPQEAQQLTLPITMPIIFGFIIMASTVKDPNSSLALFGSMFPLTSPIVMLARIPYDVPTWQIIVSMTLLVLGFLLMTWLSAKIYRTGILMYGKKVTWKEVIKWLKYH